MSLDDYPSVIPMPSSASTSSSATSARGARKKKGATGKWSKTGSTSGGKSGAASNFTGGRNLVFMVGGMSYSELRVCREVMEKESKEIIAGATAFVSPNEFIDDLATLAEN